MKVLNNRLLKSGFAFPKGLEIGSTKKMPERVLQFGEGNFLRGFVNWMLDIMNEKGLFNGKAVVVQPIEQGLKDIINNQKGLYTLYLRGIRGKRTVEKKRIITSISRAINPYSEFDEYLKCASNPDLRFIISNTTEAGIAYNPNDRLEDRPPASFPGKLTVLLYRRFKEFDGDSSKGFIIIPCELIDRNGDNLKSIVLRLSKEWGLEQAFIDWIENSNHFLNTLVDRIVTGYPRDDVQTHTKELGYLDNLLNTAEIFHLWVIEGDKRLSQELPFKKAGLNVIWTNNLTPYRTRKVRILNGAHTMTVLAAYLYGKDTVKECMDDPLIRSFMNKGIYEEIIPTLDLPEKELMEFADAVSERFSNPFIRHNILSIALNSVSKFKTRVLPSIEEYIDRKKELPQILTFSFASLIAFYRGAEIDENSLIGQREANTYKICDEMSVLKLFANLWTSFDGSRKSAKKLVSELLSKEELWGSDLNKLPGLSNQVADYLWKIVSSSMADAIREVLND